MTHGLLSEDNSIPVVRVRVAGYENLVVDCPWCRHESVFNRVSELPSHELIDGRVDGLDTRCLNEKCNKPFRIVSDSANERHELLIYDCYNLLTRKQYMHCILNLATAHEMLFGLYLRVELLYKPFAADFSSHALDELNRMSAELEERIKGYTFVPLRALFLQQLINQESPIDMDEAERAIHSIPERAGCVKGVSNAEIRDKSSASLKPLLIKLNRSTIHELRNRVVHKRAYRPTLEEAKDALDNTRSTIFPLTSLLGLSDELNWYLSASNHSNT